MVRLIAAAMLGTMTLAASAHAQAPRWVPEAGTYPYRYEAVTTVTGAPGNSFRLDYDLVSDGKGGLVAIVKGAWHRETAPEWSDVEVEDACRKEMGAQGTELARVKLAPLPPEAMMNLSTGFMPDCAPQGIFFPMTDVLTVSMIQLSPIYGLATLTKPGDSHPFPGFKVALDRDDTVLDMETTGGKIHLDSFAPGRATISHRPNANKLTLIHRRAYSGADVTLTGTESGSMRIEINPATGVLLGTASVENKLDMTMSLPGGYTQPLAITRDTKIVPRP